MIPKHVAIIMDGNGRWAKQKSMPRYLGHRHGAQALLSVVGSALRAGVTCLTVYALSQENFTFRPKKEISLLSRLLPEMLKKHRVELDRQSVRLKFIGDLSVFAEKTQALIRESEASTINNTALTLCITLNYSGRWDIVQAVNALKQVESTDLEITESLLAEYLSFKGIPDPDLLIRTGGEFRVSNFMLWQSAYTEMFFSPCLWPDFDESEFAKAIEFFSSRCRKFGRVLEEV